jgi:hypothetical protein
MNPFYRLVALRAGHRCEYCHAPEQVFNFSFEIEHIIPIFHKGTDAQDNLALACRSCNLRKSSHISGVDPETQTLSSLFHPRQNCWEEYFRVDTESGRIEGINIIARATIARLEMNSEIQLIARRQWMRLEIFP